MYPNFDYILMSIKDLPADWIDRVLSRAGMTPKKSYRSN